MKRYLCAAVFAASVLTASVMATNPAPGDTPPKAENAFQKSVPIDSGQATLTVYSQAKKLPPAMETTVLLLASRMAILLELPRAADAALFLGMEIWGKDCVLP